jgi:phage/plasmid-like protein (TIGR03299 family)
MSIPALTVSLPALLATWEGRQNVRPAKDDYDMSQESSLWLNTNTLIGFTDKRGNAWHYRQSDQGTEPNHYPMEIPVEDIKRRLFDWEPATGTSESTWTDADGKTRTSTWDKRITLIHPHTGFRLGEFTDGFQPHSYSKWLVDLSQDVMDSSIGAASAGLLQGGKLAWVQFELPETIDTPEGVSFRPNFLATDSLDGSLSTTYLRGAQLVVCDNTRAAALNEGIALKSKTKHSRYSNVKIGDVRSKLEIIYQAGEDFEAEIAAECSVKVTPGQWDEFLKVHCLPKGGEVPEKGRALTNYVNHRDGLDNLYQNDMRVAPWAGTAFGVVQAVNTYEHHIKTVKGAERAERNMTKMVTGEFDKLDTSTMAQLSMVLAA